MGTITVSVRDPENHVTQVNVPYTINTGAWPDATNTGCRVATTNIHNGFLYDSVASVTGHAISGSGTQAAPWVIDKRKYTSDIRLRNLSGKYVKFTNIVANGNGSGPSTTLEGSNYMWIEDSGPFVTVEDSTFVTPAGASTANTGGVDHGFNSYVPFTLRRCNISMACVPVYCEIERNEAGSLIEFNYLHHIWTSPGDHTDIINGNFHASHLTIKDNYLDGVRTGGSVVNNAIGLYNDPNGTQIIEDMHIIHNRFVRYNIGVLSDTNTSRVLGPWEVRDNVFDTQTALGQSGGSPYISRTPTIQSGNTVNGVARTF